MYNFCIFIVHDELKNEALNEVSQTMEDKFGYLNKSIFNLEGKFVENYKLHSEGTEALKEDFQTMKGEFGYINRSLINLEEKVEENFKVQGEGTYFSLPV